MAQQAQYRKIAKEELQRRLETNPNRPKTTPGRWDQAIEDIANGEAVVIPFVNDKERKGIRIAFGRLASERKFNLGVNVGENDIAFWNQGEKGSSESKTKRSRKGQTEEDSE